MHVGLHLANIFTLGKTPAYALVNRLAAMESVYREAEQRLEEMHPILVRELGSGRYGDCKVGSGLMGRNELFGPPGEHSGLPE